MAEVDRSRIIAYQRCPRERFLAYHLNGVGIQRIRKSLPLVFGGGFHTGSERLLSPEQITNETRVEEAVIAARADLMLKFDAHAVSFDGEQPLDVKVAEQYGQEEQLALVEALIRGWWLYEGESFLRTFEVIEVEREGRANLTDPTKWEFKQPYGPKYGSVAESDALTLMFRPDALVRDRESGDYFVISWKTCATFGKRNTDQARHDMQSISEVWGWQQSHKLREVAEIDPWDVRVEGVLYKWIVKGRRSLDKWDNLYKLGSHLIYGWLKLDTANSEFPEWSWSYDWQDEEGKSRKLGKGWQKKSIWNNYPGGVKAWVDGLAKQEIFPRTADALAEVFPQAMPVERHQKDVESWKRQVVAQEIDIAHKVQLQLSAARLPEGQTGFENYDDLLDMNFPQHSASCHSYSGCSFIPICWEGVPAQAGELYQIRTQNHPESGGDDE